MNESFDPMAARSSDFAPIIANGCAVFMPSESDTTSFYGLDVTTGRKLWDRSKQWDLQRSGQPPILLKYVGGIWNQRLIMVGDSSIIAVELATGQKIWNLELGSKIAGRGARNGNKYLVPVSQNEVVEVDIEQGAETNRFKLDHVAGNLVATDKALLCLGPSSLSFYVLKSRLQKEIDLDSLKAPDSGTTLTKKAEILLSEGKLDEAFESIRRAYLADPSNSECIDVLSKIGIAGIKTDFEKFGPRVLEFEGILSQWKGRSIYLTVMIEGYIRQRQFVRAVEKLLDLSEERTTRSSPSIENETIDHEKGLSVQIDRWMVARFERLWEMASARERKDIAKRIRDRVDVIQSSSQQQFRKGLRHLLSLELLSEQAVQAAVEQRRTSDWAEADFLLHDILRATSQPFAIEGESEDEQRTMYGKVQAKAASELAQLYSLVARHSTAVQIASKYRLPIDTWMPQPSALNPSLEDAYQFGSRLKNAMSPNDLTQLSDRPNRWPEGMVEVAAGPADQQGDLEGISIVPVLHEGKGLEGWEMRWNSDGIVMRNPWGFEAFTVPFQYNARTTSNSLIQGISSTTWSTSNSLRRS